MLLEYFIKKLEEIGDIESSSLNYKAIYSLLNGSQFIVDILTDWTEQVVSIAKLSGKGPALHLC